MRKQNRHQLQIMMKNIMRLRKQSSNGCISSYCWQRMLKTRKKFLLFTRNALLFPSIFPFWFAGNNFSSLHWNLRFCLLFGSLNNVYTVWSVILCCFRIHYIHNSLSIWLSIFVRINEYIHLLTSTIWRLIQFSFLVHNLIVSIFFLWGNTTFYFVFLHRFFLSLHKKTNATAWLLSGYDAIGNISDFFAIFALFLLYAIELWKFKQNKEKKYFSSEFSSSLSMFVRCMRFQCFS